MDATYTGYLACNMEMYYDLNAVPDGARFTDLIPANRDPTAPATRRRRRPRCPPSSSGRTAGIRTSACAATPQTGDYHALQVQVNRRYIRGVQFGAAYTLQRARGTADEDPGNLVVLAQPARDFFYSELAQSNRHSLIVNYSWDLPGRHTGAMHVAP